MRITPSLRRASLASVTMLLAACSGAARGARTDPGAAGNLVNQALPADATGRACARATELLPNVPVRGTTAGGADNFHATCAYGAASTDAVYHFRLAAPSRVSLRVAGAYDTVVHLRASCAEADSEIGCNDDSRDESHSALDANLPPGDYFAIVDGYASETGGFYTLTMTATPTRDAPTRENLPHIARSVIGQGASIDSASTGTGPVRGTLKFQKRLFSPQGLTTDPVERPVPHARVEAVDGSGNVLAQGESDDEGAFSLDVPSGRTVRVRALSQTAFLGHDIRVVSDPGTEAPYEVSTNAFTVHGGESIALRATVGGVETAGAFNILTQFVRYLPFTHRAFGRALPPLYAFWRRGNNRALPLGNITAFLHDYHRHAGSYALQIQGGDPGQEDASDSDQFDDPVILHEYTHFVVHTMAGHYSIGGNHPDVALHFPALALDEGAADALACAVSGEGRYWDTSGLAPGGSILVESDCETAQGPLRGIGSQRTAQALLWDLMDGAEDLPDRDNDGVAIGMSGLLRIYASFRDDPRAFPASHTVLERGVELGLFTQQQAATLARAPADHGFTIPMRPEQRWPVDLTLPADVPGRVDGVTQPAPSGGRNTPSNGFDAIRAYRFTLERRSMVYVDVEIAGSGSARDHTDLHLQVTTRNLEPVAAAGGRTGARSLHQFMNAGTYLVFVRDAGSGNRADFRLRVRVNDTFR